MAEPRVESDDRGRKGGFGGHGRHAVRWQRRSIHGTVAGFAVASLVLGCRLPYSKGPVPESVAACRQLSQQGAAALARGQTDEAESLLAKAVKTCSTDPEARRYYAEALWARGARQEALAQLGKAIEVSPDSAALQTRLAEMHLALGQLDQARRAAEEALDLDPKLASAWAVRGRIHRAAGDPSQALADLHRALGYAPSDRDALLDVAELQARLGRPQQALQALQSLAETYAPGEEPQEVLYRIGAAHLALGRWQDAVEQLSLALARGPQRAEILYALAEAQQAGGRTALAAAAAEQALRIDPSHQASRQLLERLGMNPAAGGAQRR